MEDYTETKRVPAAYCGGKICKQEQKPCIFLQKPKTERKVSASLALALQRDRQTRKA